MKSGKSSVVPAIILFGVILLIIALVFLLGAQMRPSISSGGQYMGQVGYENISEYLYQFITTEGYVIIPISSRACGGLAWATCKLWLDNDPYSSGLGLHEIVVPIGTSRNSVTQNGKLFDNYGQLLSLTKSKQFNWYHVLVTGQVTSCKEGKCLILAQSILGLK
jgi:hypothetical protein